MPWCKVRNIQSIEVKEIENENPKIVLNYSVETLTFKFSCSDENYLIMDLKTKVVSKYTPYTQDKYKDRSIPNSFSGNYAFFYNTSYMSNTSSRPEGSHYSFVTQNYDIYEVNNKKSFKAFNFKKTRYYYDTKFLYAEPNYDRTFNYGFMGYNDSTCFYSYNDSLFLVNYYTKQHTQKKAPRYKLSRVINYYAGYDDKSMLVLGTILQDSLEKYVLCKYDLDNGKILDSLHIFSSELTNKKNISIVGYNKELNLIITNYTDGIIYEIDDIKTQIENEKYAKLIVNKVNLILGESLDYKLETSNQITNFEAILLNSKNEIIASSNQLNASFLIQNSGDYSLNIKYNKQNNEEVKIFKSISVRRPLVCNFDVWNNMTPVPLDFRILDKCSGDLVSKEYKLGGYNMDIKDLQQSYKIVIAGSYPLTLTISDGAETKSYTKYIHALEPKLTKSEMIDERINLIYAPFNSKVNSAFGNNYFQLSDKEYKEIKIFAGSNSGDAGFYHLSRFEQTDTSVTFMNNILQDYLYKETLYLPEWSKDTLVGITKNIDKKAFDKKIIFNLYYNDSLRNRIVHDFDKNYEIRECKIIKNKVLLLLVNGTTHYLMAFDQNYNLLFTQDLLIGTADGDTYNITETEEDKVNLIILKNKKISFKTLNLKNNIYEELNSFSNQITELNPDYVNYIGVMTNNIPYIVNRNKDKYFIFKIFDKKNYQKIEMPLTIRNEGNLRYITTKNKIIFINSDTLNKNVNLFFDVFDTKTNTMNSKIINNRSVRTNQLNIDDKYLYIAGNMFGGVSYTTPYYGKIELSRLGITNSIDEPDVTSDLVFDRKSNSSINELNLEFVYTSDNIITITNENVKFTGDITIFDNSGVEVTNLGKLDFIKGENSIDLNNNVLNYKVFFMKIHSEGKNSVYKFIYIK